MGFFSTGAGPFAGAEAQTLGRPLHYFPSLPSTNVWVRGQALKGAPEGLAVVADEQTAGRGRLGRTWTAPAASGILLSVLLRPKLPVHQSTLLTMLAGVSVVATLRVAAGLDAQLKWPNDVFLQGKKVCGILTESSSYHRAAGADASPTDQFFILGIGMNVNGSSADIGLANAITMAEAVGHRLDRREILATLLSELEKRYVHLDPEAIYREWRERLDSIGRQVTVNMGSRSFAGTVEDINADGGLIIRLASGETELVMAGEVSWGGKGSDIAP